MKGPNLGEKREIEEKAGKKKQASKIVYGKTNENHDYLPLDRDTTKSGSERQKSLVTVS